MAAKGSIDMIWRNYVTVTLCIRQIISCSFCATLGSDPGDATAQQQICQKSSLKIPPHLQRVATLPCVMRRSVSTRSWPMSRFSRHAVYSFCSELDLHRTAEQRVAECCYYAICRPRASFTVCNQRFPLLTNKICDVILAYRLNHGRLYWIISYDDYTFISAIDGGRYCLDRLLCLCNC